MCAAARRGADVRGAGGGRRGLMCGVSRAVTLLPWTSDSLA
jgi:hypothetical protein